MSTRLTVNHLTVQLKGPSVPILQDVSFSLNAGQSLVILGQCGSGKSTLCRALLGLLPRQLFSASGSIQLDGQELLGLQPGERRRLGGNMAFIPQNPMTALDPSMRIGKQMRETLAMQGRMKKAAEEQKVCQALIQAGLSDPEAICTSYPFELSGGMLQRVTIAFALMSGAGLIIADEPTTALDVVHRQGVIKALLGLRRTGASILMVTHDFPTALQLGGQLLIMRGGCMIETGEMAAVFRHPKHPYTQSLIEASNLIKEATQC